MTNRNDFTTPTFASIFDVPVLDVLDLSYLFVMPLALFTPGALKTDALLAARQNQTPNRELADTLGDF
jgi:hypothetical protein